MLLKVLTENIETAALLESCSLILGCTGILGLVLALGLHSAMLQSVKIGNSATAKSLSCSGR